LDLANSHLQETKSSHFLREKYKATSRKEAARITPILADNTLDASSLLSWENVQEIWRP